MSLNAVIDVVHIKRRFRHIGGSMKGLEFAVVGRKLVPTPSCHRRACPSC